MLPSSKLRGNGVDSKMGNTKSSSSSASRPVKSVGASSVEQYKDHRVRSGSVVSRGRSTVTAPIQRDERVPTFVNVHDESERQGKGTVPELVHYARECPVHWTSKITTQNMNVVLWSWAYVAQILATRVGQAPAMQDGELEARLQHFLSVLEITLQTSSQSDFPSDAWKVARLYHTKVQQKLDSGVTDWLQMNEQWGASTLPHELMAANAEAGYQPKKASKPRGDDSTGKGAASGKSKDDKLKRLCPSWNTSETRGKCWFELEHEGLNCKYTHHCTYCKSKKLNPVNHQRHFCKRRLEDEEE